MTRTSLFLLVAGVLLAFASNSLLARVAIAAGAIAPVDFGLIRILSGALALIPLSVFLGQRAAPRLSDLPGILSLSVYVAGFSLAYLSLDAGLGALVLFGVVQVVVITASWRRQGRPGLRAIAGLALAAAGLLWLLRPDPAGTPFLALLLMVGAGLGWGFYTILGRGAPDPIGRTARNFAGAALPSFMLLLIIGQWGEMSGLGVALAVLSGAVTSGLGYALWYYVLPRLSAFTAGTSQLLVPPLAALFGALFLGEAITISLALASVLILGGVALTFAKPPAPPSKPPR